MTPPDDIVQLLGPVTTDLRQDSAAPLVDLPDVPFRVAVAPDRPDLFVVDVSGPFTVLRGQVTESGSAWTVFSQEGPTSLRAGDWMLDLAHGRVKVWHLEPDASPWRLPESDPAHGLVVPPWPGVAGLLGETGCAAWLRHRADDLGRSPDPLDHLCAAGLLLRLWSPTTAQESERAMESARAGTPWLLWPLLGWLGAGVDWAQVEQAAAFHAERLLDMLTNFTDLAARDLPWAKITARHVVADRDGLESLRVMLAAVGMPRVALEDALAELDEAAVTHIAARSDLLVMEPDEAAAAHGWTWSHLRLEAPWMDAVAANEPEAWWGTVVRRGG